MPAHPWDPVCGFRSWPGIHARAGRSSQGAARRASDAINEAHPSRHMNLHEQCGVVHSIGAKTRQCQVPRPISARSLPDRRRVTTAFSIRQRCGVEAPSDPSLGHAWQGAMTLPARLSHDTTARAPLHSLRLARPTRERLQPSAGGIAGSIADHQSGLAPTASIALSPPEARATALSQLLLSPVSAARLDDACRATSFLIRHASSTGGTIPDWAGGS